MPFAGIGKKPQYLLDAAVEQPQVSPDLVDWDSRRV